ncbi:MAG TPA: ribose-phosphate diphosphokinase [Steroidobacteraceae bacterium]|nr:ribose-phosphate diphosphokinase [Steroidobacteraceae bacterium]
MFAPRTSEGFGARVAAELGVSLAPLEEREFDGGEHKVRPLVEVRGRRCWVVHSLHGDQEASSNDRLCRALFLIGALRDAGAAHVSVCLPYLAYGRKDRRTKHRDPVTTRYVAQLFEAVGTDRVVALEVHNPAAFDNAFRCESVALTFTSLLARWLEQRRVDSLVVVSPDVGGVKRAQLARELIAELLGIEVGFAFMEKRRTAGTVSGHLMIGEVVDRPVLIVDDLIASGGTVLRAAAACREAGARRVDVAACHAVFTPDARKLFAEGGPDSILVTNSVPIPFAPDEAASLEVVDAGALVAEAMRRLQAGKALGELLGTVERPP